MPCSGTGAVGGRSTGWHFFNWARTRHLVLPTRLAPTSVTELVAAVQEVERVGGSCKALGSGWSYSDAALDETVTHVIDTSGLAANLTGPASEAAPFAGTPTAIIPFALRAAPTSVHPEPPAPAPSFVHVQTGMSIYALNFLLDGMSPPRAMATLGGANGQTVAGVISTGTHGSDVDLPPIADFVRAIHLVGPGGQEWWIEREGALALTDQTRLEAARDAGLLCPDIRIVYADRLFRAAMVSLGRMGVVHSVAIEVVPAFNMSETRTNTNWTAATSVIRTQIMSAASFGPQYVEMIVNPYRNAAGDHDVVETRRALTTASPTATQSGPDIFRILCSTAQLQPILIALSAVVVGLIATATAAALAGISWMLAIPFIGGILFAAASTGVITAATATLTTALTAIGAAIAVGGGNVADKLANICNLAVRIGQKQFVRDLVGAFITMQRPVSATAIVGQSFRLRTGQTEAAGSPRTPEPVCMREIDGLEFALSIEPGSTALFDFMNDVFALTDEFFNTNMPMGYAMSLRFTRGTAAFLGPQQFSRTAHVEFIILRGLNGQADFISRLHGIAAIRGAIPHWGLMHTLDAARVEALYADNLRSWRLALGEIVQGARAETFRTRFSRERNLEPMSGCTMPRPLVDLVRDILSALSRARGLRASYLPQPDKGEKERPPDSSSSS